MARVTWTLGGNFFSGLNNSAACAHAGVGILTSPRMAEQAIEWTPSERVAAFSITIESKKLALVQAYAPYRD